MPAKKKTKKAIAKKPVKKAKPIKAKKIPAKKKIVKKPLKVSVKKSLKPKEKTEGKLIGRVVHYFDKIKVGVIKLSGDLAAGDTIRIVGGEDTDFKQAIRSMEMDHEKINKAKKKQVIGLKINKMAREGYKVYKM
ncbi:MAG: hypothetical protein WC397_03420 [Candidatus Paceibacterota bacterium]|jgi:putative protease